MQVSQEKQVLTTLCQQHDLAIIIDSGGRISSVRVQSQRLAHRVAQVLPASLSLHKDVAQAGGRHRGRIETGTRAEEIGLADDTQRRCIRPGVAALAGLSFDGGGHACIGEVESAGRHVVMAGRHFRREVTIQNVKGNMQQMESNV